MIRPRSGSVSLVTTTKGNDMDTINTTGTTQTGWCSRRPGDGHALDEHDGRFDHDHQASCLNFVSDADHTAQLIAEARVQNRLTTHVYPNGATSAESNAVRQFAPEAATSCEHELLGRLSSEDV